MRFRGGIAHVWGVTSALGPFAIACGPTVAAPEADTTTTTTTAGTSISSSSSWTGGTIDTSTSGEGSLSSTSGVPTDVGACLPEPVPGDCSLWCQDCEDEARCAVVKENAASLDWEKSCLPLLQTEAGIGEPCAVEQDGTDACEPQTTCFGGTCIELCLPGNSAFGCEGTKRCLGLDAFGGESAFGVCLEPCDPLGLCPLTGDEICYPTISTCEESVDPGCYPLNGDGTTFCVPRPLFPDVHDHGWPCTENLDCDEPPTMCAPAALIAGCEAADGCCADLCNLSSGLPCDFAAQGESCEPLFEIGEAPTGLENVGICRLPAP